ncbi:MAG TPA: hypothetical protein VF363_09020 [Candidatus Eisenbacteria bacterium]
MTHRPDLRDAPEVLAFRAEDLAALLGSQEGPCVSLYLATHRRHPEWKQDPVRFRALIAEAESLLGGGAARDQSALVAPLRGLLERPFWEYALDGLAVFASRSLRAAYRLPIAVPDQVVVAETFHTKPLLRLLRSDGRYYALALSQNQVTLYEGSRSGAGIVELGGVPKGLRDAVGVPDFDRSVSAHGGVGGSIFHGRGPGREETKELLARYFRAIDRGLKDYLRGETAPLVLAAVKYYHPIYREGNTYPHLLAEGLEGNYERESAESIHAAAWPLVERAFSARAAEWSARYREMAGTGLAVDGVEEVALAAVAGRARCVLAAEGDVVWGLLDRATGAVARHERQMGADDGDLVDDVCEEAFRRGAEVFVLPRAAMPTDRPIAAVLRY